MPAYDSIFTGALVDEAIQKYYTIKTYNNSIWTPLALSSTSGYFLRGDGLWSNIIEGNITATKFIGNLEGNADTATLANAATELETMGTNGLFYRGDGVWSNELNNSLHLYGTTIGNTASDMISGIAGLFSWGDVGPKITFDTTATPGGAQAGALIFTDNDTAGTGVSWHFVSNQSDWNVTSKRFHARTSISIGTNLPNNSYNFYLNGTGYLNSGYFYIGTGGVLNGAATNGGINSILIGDAVWLGDCNAGGIVGMKSTGSNCGFYFYNSSGTKIGHMYTAGTTTAYINNFTFYQGGTFNANDSTAINGWRIANAVITNAPISNHGAIFSLGSVGTPCQYFYPDNQLTIYKRWYTSGAWTSWQLLSGMSSSRKIKENILPLTLEETNKIFQLNPISFDYKEGYGDKDLVGLIAEEVNEIIPSCVLKPKDEDITETCGDVIWSIDYSRLVPYLIKLAQIQQEEIEVLKERINLLEQGR